MTAADTKGVVRCELILRIDNLTPEQADPDRGRAEAARDEDEGQAIPDRAGARRRLMAAPGPPEDRLMRWAVVTNTDGYMRCFGTYRSIDPAEAFAEKVNQRVEADERREWEEWDTRDRSVEPAARDGRREGRRRFAPQKPYLTIAIAAGIVRGVNERLPGGEPRMTTETYTTSTGTTVYRIMRMAGEAAHARRTKWAGYPTSAPPKRVATVEARDAETALAMFAETLGRNYTCRETRPEQQYASAFLVARCWNGRNHHEVRWEAWK